MIQSPHLSKLLVREMRELHDTQDQLMGLLADLVYTTGSRKLEQLLTRRLGQTFRHKKRLAKALAHFGASPRGHLSRCMRTLIDETRAIATADNDPFDRDLILVVMIQRIEHIQICAYGSARMIARILVDDEVETLMDISCNEVKAMDRLLTDLSVDLYIDGPDADRESEADLAAS